MKRISELEKKWLYNIVMSARYCDFWSEVLIDFGYKNDVKKLTMGSNWSD